jgi:SAM-dependent methyltransferase
VDAVSRRRLVDLYERSLQRHGPTARAVRWTGEASQRTRFDLLFEVGPWKGVTVADVGCGVGDLFAYLRSRDADVRYTGYDIAPAMIEAARGKHQEPAARFEQRDVLEAGMGGPFDYVVASGTFNIRIDDHDAYLRRMLAAMYGACRRAMALNVLTPLPSEPERTGILAWCADFYYAVEPAVLAGWCRQLSPHVEMREGYADGECTVFVRRPEGDRARALPAHEPTRSRQ